MINSASIPELTICSLAEAKKLIRAAQTWPAYDAIISIGDPRDNHANSKPPYGFRFIPYRLRLEFDDVNADDDKVKYKFPSEKDVQQIIRFCKDSISRGDKRILIHCNMGWHRSPAAGFIYFCLLYGPGSEEVALNSTIDAAADDDGNVCPNEVMIELADLLLKRDGRMMKALDKLFPLEVAV